MGASSPLRFMVNFMYLYATSPNKPLELELLCSRILTTLLNPIEPEASHDKARICHENGIEANNRCAKEEMSV